MGFYDYAIEDAALKTADSAFLKLENDYPVFVRRSCQVTAHEFLRVFFTGEYRVRDSAALSSPRIAQDRIPLIVKVVVSFSVPAALKIEGAGFRFQVESLEDRVDAVRTFHVHKAHHGVESGAGLLQSSARSRANQENTLSRVPRRPLAVQAEFVSGDRWRGWSRNPAKARVPCH